MPLCLVCNSAFTLPVRNCRFGKDCPYLEVSQAQIFVDAPLCKVWDAIGEFQWQSLESWRVNPQNGLLFLQCLEDAPTAVELVETTSSSKKSGTKFIKIIKKEKLGFNCVASKVFAGGYWSFGFEKGQLDDSVIALRKLVRNAQKALKIADPTTKELVKAYFGDDEQTNCELLEENFGELSAAIESGIIKTKAIIICKGATVAGSRTFGYVRPESTEYQFLGHSLSSRFKCIFLTDACLTGKDPNFEQIDQKWFRATTLLHELTHLVLNTDDKKTVSGKEAYGRVLCATLVLQNKYSPSLENDPFGNADTLAYFACDLMLIKINMELKQRILTILSLDI